MKTESSSLIINQVYFFKLKKAILYSLYIYLILYLIVNFFKNK